MMKKLWKNPACATIAAQGLSNRIKAAAWSGEWICHFGDFR